MGVSVLITSKVHLEANLNNARKYCSKANYNKCKLFLRPMHKEITLSTIDSNPSSCSPAYGMHNQSQPEAEGDPAPQPPLPQLLPQDSLGRFLDVFSFSSIAQAIPF